MSSIEVKVDLSEVTVRCPFRTSGFYGGQHDHENMPDDFPCSGGYYGGTGDLDAERVLIWLCETVARLDRQLNPPPPEPEKPVRKTRKKAQP